MEVKTITLICCRCRKEYKALTAYLGYDRDFFDWCPPCFEDIKRELIDNGS